MKIQYLGTAAAEGLPGLFCRCDICKTATEKGGKDIRTRSQAIIDDCLLIDFPQDTYAHMLNYKLNLPEITNIVITHSHQDHFYAEDLTMRGSGFANNVGPKLTIYGNETVEAFYERAVTFFGADQQLRDRMDFKVIEEFVPLSIQGYTVTPLLANHDRREKCFIYLIEKDNQALLYGNDTGLFPESTWEYLAGKKLDLVSLDCTTIKHKEGFNHMGIPDNVLVKERLEKLGCVYEKTQFVINHFSHNGGMLHDDIVAAVEQYGFTVTYDGLTIEF